MADLVNLLTTEDCYIILKEHTQSKNVTLKSCTANKLPGLEGYLGQPHKLKIVYEEDSTDKELNVFLKDVESADSAIDIKVFEKEQFYLNYLLKQLKANGISTDFAPRCYHCRRPIFVLEDLSLRGYKNTPKNDMLDIKHCKVALKTLARFHASTIIYEKIKSNSDNTYTSLEEMHPEILENVFYTLRKTFGTDWIDRTYKGVFALIDLLPESDISTETFKNKLSETLESAKYPLRTSKNCIRSVLHGDLWSNNFMFKYENGAPVYSILIDYQILRYGPIALDVTHMIFVNLRRNLRSEHFEELLSYYYHQFAEVCESYGFEAHDFVSYIDFMDTCEELKIRAKIECIADHSMSFLPDAIVEEAMQAPDITKTFVRGDRSETMVLSFKTDDLFREIMSEDIVELRDLLFKNK